MKVTTLRTTTTTKSELNKRTESGNDRKKWHNNIVKGILINVYVDV